MTNQPYSANHHGSIATILDSEAAQQAAQKPFSSANITTLGESSTTPLPSIDSTNDPAVASVQSMDFLVDLHLYSQEALNAVLYTYSGKFFVEQQRTPDGQSVQVKLLLKDLSVSLNASEQRQLRGEFYQNLIDQQVRIDLEQRFGHIRDLLVAEAFKPVNP